LSIVDHPLPYGKTVTVQIRFSEACRSIPTGDLGGIMTRATSFDLTSIHLSARFVQGYRYLDRCGEVLIRLENALDPNWITTETLPTSGSLKNDTLGMSIVFNSDAFTVKQAEFIDLNIFRDQCCRTYEILYKTLEIKRINAPAFRVLYQRGFAEDELAAANLHLMGLHLVKADDTLLLSMGGIQSGMDFAAITEDEIIAYGSRIKVRRRLQASVVRQEKQPSLDQRILQRTSLLPTRQRDAIQALMRMRKTHPEIAPFAIQFDLENNYEAEFSTDTFDMPDFVDVSSVWAEIVVKSIVSRSVG
jgi:hypothetical protein